MHFNLWFNHLKLSFIPLLFTNTNRSSPSLIPFAYMDLEKSIYSFEKKNDIELKIKFLLHYINMKGLFHRTDNSDIISNDGPHLILSCVWRSISCPSFFQATLVICWTVAFLTRFRLGRQQLTPSQHNLPDTDNSFNNNSLLDVEKISNAILFI